jgi:prevent-host-death family protein
MPQEYSIAEAKNRLSEIVHEAEKGKPIRLTRRGRPVAVLVSERGYAKLVGKPNSFWERLTAFRERESIAQLDIDPATFDGIRAREPGRRVSLEGV